MAIAANLRDAMLLLSLIAQPSDVLEFRALSKINGQQHVTSGYFDDFEALAQTAVGQSGKHDGIYVTINPAHPGCLSRAEKNRIRRVGNGDTTSDNDVRTRRSILIDIDPKRPAGISSSDEEHEAALALAQQIAADLSKAGWPDPINADSGNGGHLVYAVDLPVDDGGLVKRAIAALSKRYSSSTMKIDEKVFNPSRISKIYGTLTRKGISTADRPHRYSRIIAAPAKLEIVSRSMLEALAPEAPALRDVREKTRAAYRGRVEFDLETWLADHLPDAKEKTWSEGRLWLLKECPFNAQHDRSEAYVSQTHAGVIAAGCKHDSCFSSWKELRLHFEPDAYSKTSGNGNGHRVSDREPPHEILYEDADFRARQDAEVDAFADRDREPTLSVERPDAPAITWKRAPELVDEIWSRKDDPWVGLKLGPDELCRVRAGGMAVLIGGPASGKTSLAANLLIDHARHVGPAVACSIELPADELAARIVGVRCDATWEDALRGQLPYEHMRDALAMPRLFVLERERASLANLAACIKAAQAEYPGQPILVAIDYVQLLKSSEREIRLRVADVLEQIDRLLRNERVVGIVLSQMGRGGAKSARSGEAIGTDASELGAETSAIERFATITLTIGMKGEPREDGSQNVELSLGKARMGKGDAVFSMNCWGRSGLWRVAGEPQTATEVREKRDADREEKVSRSIDNQILGAVTAAKAGMLSRNDFAEAVTGRKTLVMKSIAKLLQSGDLVEVNRRAPRSRSFMISTPDRVATLGLELVRDTLGTES